MAFVREIESLYAKAEAAHGSEEAALVERAHEIIERAAFTTPQSAGEVRDAVDLIGWLIRNSELDGAARVRALTQLDRARKALDAGEMDDDGLAGLAFVAWIGVGADPHLSLIADNVLRALRRRPLVN